MATLINGNGNAAIYAAQDADLIAALAGDTTGIAQIGNKFAATAVDANTISVSDGVIVTKEGRRIQLDAGSTDAFTIPTGTADTTNYYIIGYLLTTESDSSQVCETFVQLMESSTDTIDEGTFRDGDTDVYVSLYRVEQDGVNLGDITALLPELTSISQLNTDLSDITIKTYTLTSTQITLFSQNVNLGIQNVESDLTAYGNIIGMEAHDDLSTPCMCTLITSGSYPYVSVVSLNSYSATRSITLRVTYSTNVTTV